jgi:aerobic carbon-monoxide dehydrogenase small subunit
MKPSPLRYVRPGTLAEALALLDGQSRPLAGGQSLIGLINMRRLAVSRLVDLEAIVELQVIDPDGQTELTLGAGVTLAAIEQDPDVRTAAPLLVDAARLVANPQVRARSTLGGNVAHGDPASEIVTSLVALGATVTVRSAGQERRAPVEELVLASDELIVEVRVPRRPADGGGAVSEVSIRHAARALVVAAAAVELEDGVVKTSCVAVGGVGAAPVALGCAAQIRGLRPDDTSVGEAISDAIAQLDAAPDPRAGERYRRDVASELARRALAEAARRESSVTSAAGGSPAQWRQPLAPAPERDAGEEVRVTVNGRPASVRVEPRTLLCDMLRDSLGLTATHVGCEHGVCGACNVLVDGIVVRSCLLLAVQTDGRRVETLEGLRDTGEIDRLVTAFAAEHALQCGFCTPGFIVTLTDLQRRAVQATPADLVGNLCRCTGYAPIVRVAKGVDELA